MVGVGSEALEERRLDGWVMSPVDLCCGVMYDEDVEEVRFGREVAGQ